MGMNRREVIKAGVLVGGGVVVAGAAVLKDRLATGSTDPVGKETVRSLPVLKSVPQQREEDPLLRMQRELVHAMAKPVEQRRWMMVIDTRKCVGCHACTIACVAENKLPPGVVYRPVITEEMGEFPNVQLRFTPRPCMQCDKPPCVPVCPVKATWKRPDGVVAIDYDQCIGCGYCVTACPYNARTRDLGEYYTHDAAVGAPDGEDRPVQGPHNSWEDQTSHEYAKGWSRKNHDSPTGNARKCHFCLHRLEVGQLPACVTTCIGRATYFGDANDPESLVSEMAIKPNSMRLLDHLGTKPSVVYLI